MNHDQPPIMRKLLREAPNFEADFEEFRRQYKELTEKDSANRALVLKCHLILEFYITTYLSAANPASPRIGSIKLSFSQKIDLIDHPQANFGFLIPGVRALNTLRNKLAHRLDYVASVEDIAPIRESLKIWRVAGGHPVPEGVEVIPVFTETMAAFLHGDTKSIIRNGGGAGLIGLLKWWAEDEK